MKNRKKGTSDAMSVQEFLRQNNPPKSVSDINFERIGELYEIAKGEIKSLCDIHAKILSTEHKKLIDKIDAKMETPHYTKEILNFDPYKYISEVYQEFSSFGEKIKQMALGHSSDDRKQQSFHHGIDVFFRGLDKKDPKLLEEFKSGRLKDWTQGFLEKVEDEYSDELKQFKYRNEDAMKHTDSDIHADIVRLNQTMSDVEWFLKEFPSYTLDEYIKKLEQYAPKDSQELKECKELLNTSNKIEEKYVLISNLQKNKHYKGNIASEYHDIKSLILSDKSYAYDNIQKHKGSLNTLYQKVHVDHQTIESFEKFKEKQEVYNQKILDKVKSEKKVLENSHQASKPHESSQQQNYKIMKISKMIEVECDRKNKEEIYILDSSQIYKVEKKTYIDSDTGKMYFEDVLKNTGIYGKFNIGSSSQPKNILEGVGVMIKRPSGDSNKFSGDHKHHDDTDF